MQKIVNWGQDVGKSVALRYLDGADTKISNKT